MRADLEDLIRRCQRREKDLRANAGHSHVPGHVFDRAIILCKKLVDDSLFPAASVSINPVDELVIEWHQDKVDVEISFAGDGSDSILIASEDFDVTMKPTDAGAGEQIHAALMSVYENISDLATKLTDRENNMDMSLPYATGAAYDAARDEGERLLAGRDYPSPEVSANIAGSVLLRWQSNGADISTILLTVDEQEMTRMCIEGPALQLDGYLDEHRPELFAAMERMYGKVSS